MTSLWTIGELAWRQLNPGGRQGAKNTLEEYVQSALGLYADLVWRTYQEGKNDSDSMVVENLLKHRRLEVKEDAQGFYADMEITVLDLPRDMGLFQVRPENQKNLVKASRISNNLFAGDTGAERVYFREGTVIRFPDGFEKPQTRYVWIATLSLDDLDTTTLNITDIYGERIREGLVALYGKTVNVPADETNNNNPNR